jgi:hypothetical protein
MSRMARYVVVVTVVIAAVVGAGPALGKDTKCQDVDVQAVGVADFTTNTVDGTIVGNGILKGGVTHGEFVFTSVDPETGTATYEGTYSITTDKGTLDLSLFDGVIDLTTLQGQNDSVVTGGTGEFDGATGGLLFVGGVDAEGGFVDTLTGTICLDKNKS